MTAAEAARLIGINRSTVGRYAKRFPEIQIAPGAIDAARLMDRIERQKGLELRGCPIGRRRLMLPVARKKQGQSFRARVEKIRREIDLLSDDEQALLKPLILGFFRPEMSMPFYGARPRIENIPDHYSQADELQKCARELLNHLEGYASGAEIAAVEAAARGEMLSVQRAGMVKKLVRQLLGRVVC